MTRKETKICFAEHLLKQGELSAREQAERYGTSLATATLILEELVRSWRTCIRIAYQAGLMDENLTDCQE